MRPVPGRDYAIRLPWIGDVFDVIHLRVRTDAEQPSDYDPGYQHFNECHEYGRRELHAEGAYIGPLYAKRRMILIQQIAYSFDMHAQQWLKDDIYFEMPDCLWLISSQRKGPAPLRIEVVDHPEGDAGGILL